MKYISTRGAVSDNACSAHVIKTGLAPDGGLFMPERIPSVTLDEIAAMSCDSYPVRVAKVLSKYLTDYTYDELLKDAEDAYSSFFDFPAKVTPLGEDYMLELWHGPTCAFKDMALQIMPRLFSRALEKCHENRTAMILVATSGDTGKAALEGYKNIPGIKIKVFYPTDGVSRVQKLQMQTQTGDNVSVTGIEGNFDDAQNGVKEIFSDPDMSACLDNENIFLSSANSINWGRLVPQIVYYISAYCDIVRNGGIKLGDAIDVCVPTGNFGNIFACYIAKKMGLPIGKLICASNSNDVLTEFFNSGVYDRNRPFHATMSPSMDILISSNLERLLYVTLGADKTARYMSQLTKDGRYELTDEDRQLICADFVAYSSNEDETARTIKLIYEKENCLIDTHTAVAVSATGKYKDTNKAERRILTVSTASAYKFAKDVYKALTDTELSDDLQALSMLNSLTSVEIPTPLSDIGSRKILHGQSIAKQLMKNSVREFAKE